VNRRRSRRFRSPADNQKAARTPVEPLGRAEGSRSVPESAPRSRACLTDEEWLGWSSGSVTAASPCYDCTPEFAATERAAGRCVGWPGEEDDDRPIVERERRRRKGVRGRKVLSFGQPGSRKA